MAPTPSAEYPESTLTFGVEIKFFAALKASTFGRIRHASIAHLLGERLGRLRLQGPEGAGAVIKVASENEENSSIGRGVDYACWTVTADRDVEPDYPEWFTDCTKPCLVFLQGNNARCILVLAN
jgi:hypothetical protein